MHLDFVLAFVRYTKEHFFIRLILTASMYLTIIVWPSILAKIHKINVSHR